MIATPCWPRAGPIGGAGVAFPAGICNLTYPLTRFATVPNLLARCPRQLEMCELAKCFCVFMIPARPVEIELDRRLASKERDEHADFAFFLANFVDLSAKVR